MLVGKSDKDILAYMIMHGNVLDLMESIAEQGFFQGEPLLVIPKEKASGHYIVVEGNRRLSAVKLLLDPNLAVKRTETVIAISKNSKHTPTSIPVVVYPKRDDIIDYLGYRHITGIKEWNSLEKAKYLKGLFEKSKAKSQEKKYQELAKIIGTRTDYVKKLLCALAVYDKVEEKNFFGIRGLEDGGISFSLITTALGYKNIRTYMGLRQDDTINIDKIKMDNLAQITKWMFDKSDGQSVVEESRQIRQLAYIVANEESKRFLIKSKDIEAAFLLSSGVEEMIKAAVKRAHDSLKMAHNYTRTSTLLDVNTVDSLNDIKNLSDTILKVAKNDD